MVKQLRLKDKRLGKRAHIRDTRTLRLHNYLTRSLPPAPLSAGYYARVLRWPMYQNDVAGDCVEAAAGHMIEQWTSYAARQVQLTDADVIGAYTAMTGYDPNDPTTDNGTDMLTALKYWKKTGYAGHKIAAYVSVNPKNQEEISQAIYLFGNLYAGIQMPLSAQDQPVWQVPPTGLTGDGSPGSWGGHCVPLVAYKNGVTSGLKTVSWGQVYSVTWPFLHSYADELWAVLSADWIAKTGSAPCGFALAQLQADLTQIK